jgi:hypothetical protein
MSDDRERSTEEFMEEVAPIASRLVLEEYVGVRRRSTSGDPTELIRRAIERLPKGNAKIRTKRDVTVVKGLTWLLNEIPEDSPSRGELSTQVDALARRAGYR